MRLLKGKCSFWLILTMGTLFLSLMAQPAWTVSFTPQNLIYPTLVIEQDQLPPLDLTEIYISPALATPAEPDEIADVLQGMIYFENLESFNIFSVQFRGYIPLNPVGQILFIYSVNDPNYPLKMYLMRSTKPGAISAQGFRFLLAPPLVETVRGVTLPSEFRDIGRSTAQIPSKESEFFWGFLTEDAGLFSGSPWNWNNVLLRVLTITGFLLLVFVGTEALRYILGFGKYRRGRNGG